MEGNDSNKFNTILHDTKEKYKQLTSSLVLTSTLISQKNKIYKIRLENNQKKAQIKSNEEYEHLLTANKINIEKDKTQEDPTSNLKKLKEHAQILEEENILSLGKLDNHLQEQDANTNETLQNNFLNNAIALPKKVKKPHKRKIVKGRPEMYAIVKKRKLLMAVLEDDHP